LSVSAIVLIIHLMLRHGLYHFGTIHGISLWLRHGGCVGSDLHKQAATDKDQGKGTESLHPCVVFSLTERGK